MSDAFLIFNRIASYGSYISALSGLFFFYVVFVAFTEGERVINPSVFKCKEELHVFKFLFSPNNIMVGGWSS